jgi:4-hydroxy 2-oxovalerate aldolase
MGLDYRIRCCPDGLMTDRRRQVKVVDCTLRDGGICNHWQFSEELASRLAEALERSGVDVMEVGYQISPDRVNAQQDGPWRTCPEPLIARVFQDRDMKLACMVDHGRFDATSLRPAEDSVIDILRVATYGPDIQGAIETCEAAIDLGYEVYCHVMAVTTCTPQQVDGFLECLRGSRVTSVAVVDSYGAMYPHQIRYLMRKYKNWLRADQEVGVHLHNNQQTAFANAIAAIDEGADFVDGTVFGMGRGAGNVPLELLLMYLDDERHDVRPILELIDEFMPMRDDLKWGYQVPYGISGWLNRHPADAIDQMRQSPTQSLEFYDSLTKDHPRNMHHRPEQES